MRISEELKDASPAGRGADLTVNGESIHYSSSDDIRIEPEGSVQTEITGERLKLKIHLKTTPSFSQELP